jgi:hypothetical protein
MLCENPIEGGLIFAIKINTTAPGAVRFPEETESRTAKAS